MVEGNLSVNPGYRNLVGEGAKNFAEVTIITAQTPCSETRSGVQQSAFF